MSGSLHAEPTELGEDSKRGHSATAGLSTLWREIQQTVALQAGAADIPSDGAVHRLTLPLPRQSQPAVAA